MGAPESPVLLVLGESPRSASCSSEVFMPDQVSMQIKDWQVTCIFFLCAYLSVVVCRTETTLTRSGLVLRHMALGSAEKHQSYSMLTCMPLMMDAFICSQVPRHDEAQTLLTVFRQQASIEGSDKDSRHWHPKS